MSMPDLLIAVRDRIRSALSYPNAQCDVQPDGSPEPSSGQVYVAVHPGDTTNEDDLSLDESYELFVTLTMKVGYLPVDQLGQELLLKARTGIYARARAIALAVHMKYEIMDAANASIGDTANGFHHPLVYRRMPKPVIKGPDWFNAEDDPNPPAGLAIEIRFDGARRKQTLESMM